MHTRLHHVKENMHETHEVLDELHEEIIEQVEKMLERPHLNFDDLCKAAAAIHHIAVAEKALMKTSHMVEHMQKMHGHQHSDMAEMPKSDNPGY